MDKENGNEPSPRISFLPDSDASDMVSTDKRTPTKEQWGSKLDFLLSVLGYTVGFGNVWRFPYVCMKNGGGAFLIPYLITIFLLAVPMYFLEASLGQFSGKTMQNVWCYCPLIRGEGLGLLLMLMACVWYYVMLTTWVLYYLYQSFFYPLPWSTCGNEWNTPDCFSFTNPALSTSNVSLGNTTMLVNTSSIVTTHSTSQLLNASVFVIKTGHSSEEEFWQYKVLDISSGFDDVGSIKGHLALCLLIAWIVVYLCVIKGIRSTGKVVYVTATLPYILLTVILIRSLTLPGAIDGVIFFVKPDFPSLLNIQVWLEAAIQVFYSVAMGWGVLITLSSFNKFNNNCYRDAFLLTLAGEGTSIFAGFVIFSALGFMAHKANVSIVEVAKSGPGLGFVAYPEALSQMPFPNFWSVLFFLAMFTVGLDSQDSFPLLRRRRAIFRACLAVCGFLLGLAFCTGGGIYLFQLIDWYCAAFSPILFTLMECITISWVYGAERFSRDIEMMLGRPVPTYMRFCWCFLSPVLTLGLLITSFLSYVPPTYGDYVYPPFASVLGWLFAVMPVVPVVVIGVITLWRSPGETFYQNLKKSLQPSSEWGPASDQKPYSALEQWHLNGSFKDKLLINIGYRKKR
ncbi:sodium- and chloride-dependent glycine transporter 2-like isoform X2 [Mizuhopecten yessoensis]|uniref:sodium- and chloride-dependent glycine transporter 2-like isoform X2 n=1 Tax=Mizuhopecten yessoensis TaxID=6573 RepID=UPI000B45BFBD|nr:sodium- and chloride-dependent glycine transporter 2-like isoform X2 [Mizuhopecten yessoensis]